MSKENEQNVVEDNEKCLENNKNVDSENEFNNKKETEDAKEECKENNDACKEVQDEIDYKKCYEQKSKELEELKNRHYRLQADFDNFRKRVDKEKKSIYSYANEKIISEFLEVIDNFERAFLSSKDEDKDEGFYEGIQMVYKQLTDILDKNGLEKIEAINKKFDPNIHQAVMQEESQEHEEGIVIEVLQEGYKLNNKVIRPSMVKVSK